jgi:hypothetical protein
MKWRVMLLTLLMLWSCSAFASNWYAKPSPDGSRVQACIQWPESIDESLAAINTKLGDCLIDLHDYQLAAGFVIRCPAAKTTVMIYRHERDCLALKTAAERGQKLDLDDVVPPGMNPGAWITALSSCYRTGVTKDVVTKARLQKTSDYCECMANAFGNVEHDDEQAATAEAMAPKVQRCARQALGSKLSESQVRDLLSVALKSKASENASRTRGSASARTFAKGDAYADVTAGLAGFSADKNAYGDYLDVTYRPGKLSAYPDTEARCLLTFHRGILQSCSGCDPKRFTCEE